MSVTQERILAAKQALESEVAHDLAYGFRRAVLVELGGGRRGHVRRTRLAIGAMRACLPIAGEPGHALHDLAVRALAAAEASLRGQKPDRALQRIVDEGVALVEASGEASPALVQLAFGAVQTVGQALVDRRLAKGPPDAAERDSDDVTENDASFFAATLHADGDAARRRAFWRWWLDELVPWSVDGRGRLAPVPRPAPRKTTRARERHVASLETPALADRRLTSARDGAIEELGGIDPVWAWADDGLLVCCTLLSPADRSGGVVSPVGATVLWTSAAPFDVARPRAAAPQIEGVAPNATHIAFWAVGALHRVARRGADGARRIAKADCPFDMAVDETSLYWTTREPAGLHAVDNDGRRGRTLARGLVGKVVVGPTHVFVLTWRSGVGYEGIVSVPKAGGEPELVAARTKSAVVHPSTRELLYEEKRRIVARDARGRARAVASLKPGDDASDLFVRGDRLFVVGEAASTSITSVPLSGGPRRVVAEAQPRPELVGGGAEWLWWRVRSALGTESRLRRARLR